MAAIITDITSTTGIELMAPALDFPVVVRYRWSRRRFLPAEGRQALAPGPPVSHKTSKTGVGPISSIPVVEVISVVIAATDEEGRFPEARTETLNFVGGL